MMKKLACILLSITFMLSAPGQALALMGTEDILIKKGDEGDNVILLQLRLQDLGFYGYKITGFFGDFTIDALKDFQTGNSISSDGVAGKQTLDLMYSNDAKRKTVKPIDPPKSNNTTNKKPSTKKGKDLDWSVVNQMWKKDMNCKVIDYDTGRTYTVKRVNNSYSVGHADVAPTTKAGTDAMRKTFGGSFNGYRRALLVNIGGQWIAASLFGEPHGSTGVPGNGMNQKVGNNPDGILLQVCIHFKNSWTNGHGMVDPAHQWQIRRAAGKANTGPRPTLVYPGD